MQERGGALTQSPCSAPNSDDHCGLKFENIKDRNNSGSPVCLSYDKSCQVQRWKLPHLQLLRLISGELWPEMMPLPVDQLITDHQLITDQVIYKFGGLRHAKQPNSEVEWPYRTVCVWYIWGPCSTLSTTDTRQLSSEGHTSIQSGGETSTRPYSKQALHSQTLKNSSSLGWDCPQKGLSTVLGIKKKKCSWLFYAENSHFFFFYVYNHRSEMVLFSFSEAQARLWLPLGQVWVGPPCVIHSLRWKHPPKASGRRLGEDRAGNLGKISLINFCDHSY